MCAHRQPLPTVARVLLGEDDQRRFADVADTQSRGRHSGRLQYVQPSPASTFLPGCCRLIGPPHHVNGNSVLGDTGQVAHDDPPVHQLYVSGMVHTSLRPLTTRGYGRLIVSSPPCFSFTQALSLFALYFLFDFGRSHKQLASSDPIAHEKATVYSISLSLSICSLC